MYKHAQLCCPSLIWLCLQALSRANSTSPQPNGGYVARQAASPARSGPQDASQPPTVLSHPRPEAALATNSKRGPAAARSPGPALAAAPALAQRAVGSPEAAWAAQTGTPGNSHISLQHASVQPSGSTLGSQRLVVPPAGNDFEPNVSALAECPHSGSGSSGGSTGSADAHPGFRPPSPISLLPRYDPSSPSMQLRPHLQPPSPIDLRPRYEPPSPITLSLAPRQEPPSPGSQLIRPPQRPYSGLGRTLSLGRWAAGQPPSLHA